MSNLRKNKHQKSNNRLTLTICTAASLAIFQAAYGQTSAFKITADDGAAHDQFGRSVSISGDYAVVGARGDDDNGIFSGSAYIFKLSSTSWVQEAKLLPLKEDGSSDGDVHDEFGFSVSISGDYAIVGAHRNDDNGSNSGSAYIFKRTGTSWDQEAKLLPSDGASDDMFGWSVSISGDYAVVGAWWDDDNGSNSGSAYIFKRSGTSWVQEAKLLPSDGAAHDQFGYSASISGNYTIVGARKDDDNGTNSGAAYMFKRSGTSWVQETKLLPTDGASEDMFGWSVSISGDHVVVGATRDDDNETDAGSAYLFKRTGTSWTEEVKILPTDGAGDNQFGVSVSIFGDYAIVGANRDDDNGTYSGSVYILKRTGRIMAQETKLLPSDGAFNDLFGYSASVSSDYAVVGAESDDDSGSASGSAFPFEGTTTIWAEETKLLPYDGDSFDWFGYSVSISGDYTIVGAYGDDDNGTESGSAYIFKRTGKNRAEKTELAASDGAALDEFGFSVSPYLIKDSEPQASRCVTPPPHMAAWWSLDETSGTIADDIAGFNSAGTFFGAPVPVPGKVDGALRFNGATDYVETADHPDLNFGTGDFSIDAWVKTNVNTGTRTVADKRSGTNYHPLGYSFYIYNGYAGLQLADKSGFYNRNNEGAGSTLIADGQWHHIAVTVARNDYNGIRFYVDGVLESIHNPMPYNGSLDNSSVFRIGSQSYVVDPDYMFNGVIDELGLFNRVITPAEVQAIWAADSLGKCKSPVSVDED